MGITDEIELIDDTIIEEVECNGNGLVFRCTVNTYLSKHSSIEQRKSLRLLKRRSCECQKCTWPIWDDFLYEEIANGEDIIDKLEDQKIYKLMISGGRDYYSGIYEIDDVYFKEIK